jgi:transcriptional regulator with GAF, ATPase, and Fis domain
LPELEAFSERLASCGDPDSLLDTGLNALSTIFGIDHSFVMALDEDGTRLYTLASHGYAESGEGSEACVGEGILGVAAERRVVVRTTSLARDMLFPRAVRSAVRRRGKEGLLEKQIALPGLPDVQSQLAAPLVVRNRLPGVLCLQSAVTGRFPARDERLIQIAARHLAATMAMLARPDATVPKTAPPRRAARASSDLASTNPAASASAPAATCAAEGTTSRSYRNHTRNDRAANSPSTCSGAALVTVGFSMAHWNACT